MQRESALPKVLCLLFCCHAPTPCENAAVRGWQTPWFSLELPLQRLEQEEWGISKDWVVGILPRFLGGRVGRYVVEFRGPLGTTR